MWFVWVWCVGNWNECNWANLSEYIQKFVVFLLLPLIFHLLVFTISKKFFYRIFDTSNRIEILIKCCSKVAFIIHISIMWIIKSLLSEIHHQIFYKFKFMQITLRQNSSSIKIKVKSLRNRKQSFNIFYFIFFFLLNGTE